MSFASADNKPMAEDSQPARRLATLGAGFADWAERFDDRLNDDYSLGSLNALAQTTLFVEQEGKMGAREYESTIAGTGQIPTRPDHWHDRFNALTWLRFPDAKRAVNAALVAEHARRAGDNRNRRADALTMLDETGIVLITNVDDLSSTLRAHSWNNLFIDHRDFWGTRIIPVVYGHGLLEQLLNPYIGLIGRVLIIHSSRPLESDSDSLINAQIPEAVSRLSTPKDLPPLPVLGIPGWHGANETPDFYANVAYFRPAQKV